MLHTGESMVLSFKVKRVSQKNGDEYNHNLDYQGIQ